NYFPELLARGDGAGPAQRGGEGGQILVLCQSLLNVCERGSPFRGGNRQARNGFERGNAVRTSRDQIEQSLFAFHIDVEGALCDSKRGGNVAHLRVAIAALDEDLGSVFHQLRQSGCWIMPRHESETDMTDWVSQQVLWQDDRKRACDPCESLLVIVH